MKITGTVDLCQPDANGFVVNPDVEIGPCTVPLLMSSNPLERIGTATVWIKGGVMTIEAESILQLGYGFRVDAQELTQKYRDGIRVITKLTPLEVSIIKP